MPVSGNDMRNVMGRFATGVTVVTLIDDQKNPQGFTVNSLTSVSLDPPLILVCVDHSAHILRCFSDNNVFTVNILSEKQEEVSSQFASKLDDKFVGIVYEEGELGPPRIQGCLGYLECKIIDKHLAGDQTIFIGRVEVTEVGSEEDNPLLFYTGKYARL